MNIGLVTKLTGASPKAIRNYESIGLIYQIPRKGKYRTYNMNDVTLIRLIRTAQKLGFKLSELVALTEEGKLPSWKGIRDLVNEKCSAVDQEIARLDSLREDLKALSSELDSCPDLDDSEIDLSDIECDLVSKKNLYSN
jgi:DNA-binding transcriptional MerR regulator